MKSFRDCVRVGSIATIMKPLRGYIRVKAYNYNNEIPPGLYPSGELIVTIMKPLWGYLRVGV